MPDNGLRVLYIDDDSDLAHLVRRILARHGHSLEHAGSAEQGLARIDASSFDVVCLDHYLPTGTGLDVLRVLQERSDAPPVVYVTSSSEMKVAVSALKSGAFEYVVKTATGEFPELLVTAIEQAADRARLLRAKEQIEHELREAKERAELLLQEVNHRVANSLAMVTALIRLQFNAVDDPAARAALTETQGRISAIAGVHRLLHTAEDVRYVDVGAYLDSLIQEVRSSVVRSGVDVLSKLDHVLVPTRTATSVGVIAFELLTNALKYAYPGGSGQVRVMLECTDDQLVSLSVEDDGIGWHGEDRPKGTGLGSRLVEAMAANLQSAVEYVPRTEGTRAVLRFSAAEPADTPDAAGA